MYYPAEAYVTPLTLVRRERVLPAPGEILVRQGEHVEPLQVVARAELPGPPCIVPVARLLDVPLSRLKKYLRVRPGDAVEKGQPVARRGFRTVEAPVTGSVKLINRGRVIIETQPRTFELQAYIPGTVTQVVAQYGLAIETTAALIQGVWGGGGAPGYEAWGVLKCLVDERDAPLRAHTIDISCHGLIIVGGAGLNEAVLEQAETFNVRGIVVGGLAPEMIPRVQKSPVPVVVIEGIGAAAMSEPAFRLLKTNDGREAAISVRVQPRWPVIRPEVVIPLPATRASLAQTQAGTPLEVGTKVRLVRAPYMGTVGTVKAIPSQARSLETGARVYGAEVDVGGETDIFVPLVNLEALR
jgi:hypothetical protein